MRAALGLIALILTVLFGCVDHQPADEVPPDGGAVDARVDAGTRDAAPRDAGDALDAAIPDAGARDAEPVDARPVDAVAGDAASADVGSPDAGGVDGAPGDAAPICRAGCEDPAVVEHRIAAREGCTFRLARAEAPEDARAIVAEIAAATRGRVPFTAVDLNREAIAGITADAADRLRNHPYEGLRWNAGDMATTDWYPQGITGISDAVASADPPARRLFVVSWYDHRDVRPTKGVRISLVDATDPDAIAYRHLLLVVPVRVGGQATFEAVTTGGDGPLHAGGIVWIGDLLYVADTTQGLRVFDLGGVIEVDHFDDRDRIGVGADRTDAHGYRYIVPQIARYTLTADSCPIRFSFAGLDRSADPPLIVTGEYRADDAGGRLARWPVGADGWLEAPGGVVTARQAFVGAQTRMQGALSWDGAIYISASSQAGRLGRLYRTRPGLAESSISAWVYGCEDLYLERHTDRIWTAAEHPDARDVVSIRRLAP